MARVRRAGKRGPKSEIPAMRESGSTCMTTTARKAHPGSSIFWRALAGVSEDREDKKPGARAAMRLPHFSPRTEEAYVGWMQRFRDFCGRRDSAELGPAEASAFLSSLASTGRFAAATQNQALAAQRQRRWADKGTAVGDDLKRERKRAAMDRVGEAQEILRRWEPIGVPPGELAPPDEYDSYAPQIVSMAVQGCSREHLRAHLENLRTSTIGVGTEHERDWVIAHEITEVIRE